MQDSTQKIRIRYKDVDESSSEHDHQSNVVSWLEERGIVFFAVPNASAFISSIPPHRRIKLFSKMGEEGVRWGVPDIMILTPSLLIGKPVALEMKKIPCKDLKKHKLPCKCMDENQVLWKEKVKELGWTHILAHGYLDAIEALENLGY